MKTISYWDMQEAYLIRCTLEALAIKFFSGKSSSASRKTMQDLVNEIGEAAKEQDLYGIIEADEAFHSCIIEEAGGDQLYRMLSLIHI